MRSPTSLREVASTARRIFLCIRLRGNVSRLFLLFLTPRIRKGRVLHHDAPHQFAMSGNSTPRTADVISTVSAPAISSFRGSLPHPTHPRCTLRVRHRCRLTQHSLPGGLLPVPDLHRLNRASFAWRTYSITSSARTTSVSGIVMPRAFAVLRLTTISNRAGRSTGRSAGLAPAKIRAT